MKLIDLKNKIGMNLIAVMGWIIGFTTLVCPNIWGDGSAIMLVLIVPIMLGFVCIFIGVYFIELLLGHIIKNKFFIENPIYNIFFILGLGISVVVLIISVSMFICIMYGRN